MRHFPGLVVSLVLTAAGFGPVATRAAEPVQIVDARAATPVALQGVVLEGDVLTGQVLNRASQSVRDVTLLVEHAFVWNNEFQPGKDDPSRAEYYTVQGEIPAGGSLRFSMNLKEPLPHWKDGSFVTRAQVARYTEVGVSPASNSHTRPGALSPAAIRGVALDARAPFFVSLREARGAGALG